MPKFSIIIPVYSNELLTKKCIASIKENSKNYEIIIINNNPKEPYHGPEKIIYNEENKGFPAAVNQGLAAAQGEILIILNNDTLVTPDWLEKFEKHLKIFDLVGASTNNISGLQQVPAPKFTSTQQLNEFAYQQEKQNKDSVMAWHKIVFFCVAFKQNVFKKIGNLDEQFTPGNFEDDDYCLRAIESGFKLGIAYDIFIYHTGSATHKILNLDHTKLLANNQEKFNNKWTQEKYKQLKEKATENAEYSLINPESQLTLVMIVKNEEKGLERAIQSSRGLVKEIIIAIDNSTTDKTEEVARKYATTIKHFDFHDNYSEARNFAQAEVKTDWILMLDGHEYIKQAPLLFQALKRDYNCLLCTIEMENRSEFYNPRIFKKEIQFKGAIHEQQQCTSLANYKSFIIKHDRTNNQTLEASKARELQRQKQMPEIMGKMAKDNPKNTRATFHLFLFYISRQEFKKAKKYEKLFLEYSTNKDERWFVFYHKAMGSLTKKKYFKAYLATCAAEKEQPERWEIAKIRGTLFASLGQNKRALEYLVESFNENKQEVAFKPLVKSYDQTWDLIGQCLLATKKYFEASEAFLQSSRNTEDKEYKELLTRRSELMLDIARNQKIK